MIFADRISECVQFRRLLGRSCGRRTARCASSISGAAALRRDKRSLHCSVAHPVRIGIPGLCTGAVECKIKSDLLQLFSVVDRELISLRLSSNVTTRRLERSSSGSRCSVCSNGVLLPLSRCSGESVIKKATITVALGSG